MTTKIILSDGSILDASLVMSCKYTSSVNSDTDIKIGSACSDCIDVTLWGDDIAIQKGELLTYYRVDENGNEFKMGEFIAQKPTVLSDNTYRVTVYDFMASKFEASCVNWLSRTMFLNGDETYTLSEFAKAVCKACSVKYGGNGDMLNTEYIVRPFALDNGTFRQIIQWIAEVGGCYARMNENGELSFSWYHRVDSTLSPTAGSVPYITKDGGMYMTVLGEPYYVKAHGVGLGIYSQPHEDYSVTPVDAIRVILDENTVEAGNGVNVYEIDDNPIFGISPESDVSAAAENILERLAALEYTPCTISLVDNSIIHCGDIVDVYTTKGKRYTTVVMQLVTGSGSPMEISSTGNPDRDSPDVVSSQSQKPYTKAQSQRDVSKMIRDAIAKAEANIRGEKGGVKIDRVDENGRVYETLYLDTPDIATAKNVLRINSQGIGFSTNGVDGDFTMALSIDGGLVNQWVKTWKVSGAEIECDKGKIGGLTLGENSLSFDFRIEYPEFTYEETQYVGQAYADGRKLPAEELEKYDLNFNGYADPMDVTTMMKMIEGDPEFPRFSAGKFSINTSSIRETIVFEITEGYWAGSRTTIGLGGMSTPNISAEEFRADGAPGLTKDIVIGNTTLIFKCGLLVDVREG